MKKPDAWGNSVNIGGGLYSKDPIPLYKAKNLIGEYYDKLGNWGQYLGTKSHHGYIGFASISKKEVEFWTKGATAFQNIIKGIVT
jgi:hypothetical protein